MKLWAVLAVLLAVTQTTVPVVGQTPDNNRNVDNRSEQKSGTRKTPSTNKASVPEAVNSNNPKDNSKHTDSGEAKDTVSITEFAAVPNKRDWVDYTALAINFVLVGITIAGVWAALRGLPGILKQAKAAEDAALAAKKSADAQINIERPWLLLEDLNAPRYTSLDLSPVKLTGGFHYTIRNYGKTPARVIALKMRFQLGDSIKIPPNPADVFGSPDFLVNPHVIPQDDQRRHLEPLHHERQFTDTEDWEIAESKIFLWAYGFVRYQDVHGGYYETRICYRYNPKEGELQIDGPPEYNNAT